MTDENQPNEPENQNVDTPAQVDEFETTDTAEGAATVEISEVDQLKAQVADAEKRVLLAQADLENFRKRKSRDLQDQMKYASLNLMSELLESVDNLQRAIESYQQEPNGDALSAGVSMVSTQIAKALENHGCKKIDSVGQTFDPNLHQALQMQPSDDHAANTVMMDLRAGFQLHDRLIRPAQVFVSTGPAAE
jgi:molecular chaperone GrpE